MRAWKSEVRGNVQMWEKSLEDGCLKGEAGGCTAGEQRADERRDEKIFKIKLLQINLRVTDGPHSKHRPYI